MKHPHTICREEFDQACEAVWTEIEYVNNLPRRTSDEAKDVPGFLTLARLYMDRTAAAWADQPGKPCVIIRDHEPEFMVQVPDALAGLRKVAGIMVRAMIYNGAVPR